MLVSWPNGAGLLVRRPRAPGWWSGGPGRRAGGLGGPGQRAAVRLGEAGLSDIRPAYGFAFSRLAPDGATGQQLAVHLGVTRSAASQLVDEMEERGYVRRQPHPTDRRGKLVVLTGQGRAGSASG